MRLPSLLIRLDDQPRSPPSSPRASRSRRGLRLVPGLISMAPSKVVSRSSGVPVTAKRFLLADDLRLWESTTHAEPGERKGPGEGAAGNAISYKAWTAGVLLQVRLASQGRRVARRPRPGRRRSRSGRLRRSRSRTTRSADGAGGDDAESQAQRAPGVVAQTVAASTRLSPISVDVSFANARSIVSDAAGDRAIVEIRGVADVDRRCRRVAATRGSPDPACRR